jgi:hypothetical protein|tara:strand:+ start:2706 stop:3587 length:882 start_codon:yes stop_codon:yes gene_type:complete
MSGDKEDKQESKQSSTTESITDLPQTAFFKEDYLPWMRDLFKEKQTEGTTLPGETYATQTPEQKQAHALALGAVPGMEQGLGTAMQGLGGMLDPLAGLSNLRAAVSPHIEDIYRDAEGRFSDITDAGVGAGQLGSTRQGIAQGNLGEDINRRIAEQIDRTLPQLYGTSMQGATAAAPLYADLLRQKGFVGADTYSQVGADKRAETAGLLQDQFMRNQYLSNEDLQRLAMFQNLANINAGGRVTGTGTSEGTTTVTRAGPTPFEMAMGVGSVAGSIFGGLGGGEGMKAMGWVGG